MLYRLLCHTAVVAFKTLLSARTFSITLANTRTAKKQFVYKNQANTECDDKENFFHKWYGQLQGIRSSILCNITNELSDLAGSHLKHIAKY